MPVGEAMMALTLKKLYSKNSAVIRLMKLSAITQATLSPIKLLAKAD
ncbi:MAG: hypothetical protein Ct9H300mP19_05500 [Dehalococcoidia bacterium]|nr:MAG: hypothetical protein Ct9H300mP19_05500 [Dehalococcoidia bacterium]